MTQPTEQPMPTGNGPAIFDLVRTDLATREQVGIRTYGTTLRAHNGRDALRDAYEEALDLALYLRQAIAERDTAAEAAPPGNRLTAVALGLPIGRRLPKMAAPPAGPGSVSGARGEDDRTLPDGARCFDCVRARRLWCCPEPHELGGAE
ncbi:hypothetical protein Val02_81880 [Virgisporangium aliadipatigenens]|uniref:Uncharacterized protein n=1 Tax=Virgisporangium aliadipatigenens TaxID=741659 RepID=A0A8J3YV92_9ACTN|nr:hypothetical protein [Virgisporangium aliadipatigenens]GIJ51302.1 hypothetical protein Val02_81880 [Virgisporangium aliadipatigenens]